MQRLLGITFVLLLSLSTSVFASGNENLPSETPQPEQRQVQKMRISTADYMSLFTVKVNNMFSNIFNPQLTGGVGTGFIANGYVHADGRRVIHIFTNKHVIETGPGTMQNLTVDFHGGSASGKSSFPAKLVYKSEVHDFAVIEVSMDDVDAAGVQYAQAPLPFSQHLEGTPDAKNLNQLEAAIRSAPMIFPALKDKTVYAVGNPLGSDDILTKGTVNGIGTGNGLEHPHIQIQTPINPGNSGGPLVWALDNQNFIVVGMNTAGIPNANNVGYSIPIGMLMQEYFHWMSGAIIPRPKDYVLYKQLDPASMKELGYDRILAKLLPPQEAAGPALQVATITRGSPLQARDILLKIEGQRVYSMYQFKRNMASSDYKHLKELNIEVLRNGELVKLKMPLAPLEFAQARKELDFVYISGFVFQQMPGKMAAALRPDIKSRVFLANMVASPEMMFNPRLNMIPPMSLLESIDIDGKNFKVDTLFDLKMAIKNAKHESVVVANYYPRLPEPKAEEAQSRHRMVLPTYLDQISSTRISNIEVITPKQLSLRDIKEHANLDPYADETSRHWRNYVNKPKGKACLIALSPPSTAPVEPPK